jgi:hypothetical protein
LPSSNDTIPQIGPRELLLAGFGWFPFFRRRSLKLAGAKFRIVRHGSAPRRYLHIHGNEQTARDVLHELIRKYKGTAFFIEGNERNVPIRSGWIDPNRMFSRAGAEKSLKSLDPSWNDAQIAVALDELDRGRERLLKAILPAPGALLIAVHNNLEGYAIQDEIPISDEVSLKQPDHPHEFFLCSEPADFAKLAASPYNVVLQNHPKGDDDGSLSRVCARRGLRYLNLECEIGKKAEQVARLEWAEKNL